jgi:NADH-quinone oxidoreductase subunit L
MTDMGGLRKYLKWTHVTFLIACLAIAGIPPFAGFWSKDEILVAALHKDKLLFAVEFLVAGLTAFYMFRLYFGVFWNTDPHYHHKPHESPATMLIPLIFLAVASIGAGFVPFHHLVTSDGKGFDSHLDYMVAIPSIAFATIGIFSAWYVYKKERGIADKIAASFKGLYTAALNKFYFDELYLFVTRKIIFRYISAPIAWFDRQVIDGTMNGIGYLTEYASEKTKRLQSGQVHQYVFVFVTGAVLLAIAFIYVIAR